MKKTPAVSKEDLKVLMHVATCYEGNERTRLYSKFIVAKLIRIEDGFNMPVKCESINAESSEDELREALRIMGC